jgi:hypothetical protein
MALGMSTLGGTYNTSLCVIVRRVLLQGRKTTHGKIAKGEESYKTTADVRVVGLIAASVHIDTHFNLERGDILGSPFKKFRQLPLSKISTNTAKEQRLSPSYLGRSHGDASMAASSFLSLIVISSVFPYFADCAFTSISKWSRPPNGYFYVGSLGALSICPPGSCKYLHTLAHVKTTHLSFPMTKTDCIEGKKFPCPESYYGVSEMLSTKYCTDRCWEGHYCTEGSATPTPCPPGSYCVDGIKHFCSAGRFGNREKETSALCTDVCPVGHYCPRGTVDPIPCEGGLYGETTGLQTATCR